MKLVARIVGALLAAVLALSCHAGGRPVESAGSRQQDTAVAEPVATAQVAGQASASLRQRLSGLKALTAGFEQDMVDGEGFQIQSMTGEMTVARPGYIHWRTDPPYEQLLVSDADTLWLYDRDLAQVTVRPFYRDIVNSPAMLFVGDITDMDDQYLVSARTLEDGREEYTLVPRDDSAVYRQLTLSFHGEAPVTMELRDSLGQLTRIRFVDVRLNPEVDEALFRFQIPPGVDVLHND